MAPHSPHCELLGHGAQQLNLLHHLRFALLCARLRCPRAVSHLAGRNAHPVDLAVAVRMGRGQDLDLRAEFSGHRVDHAAKKGRHMLSDVDAGCCFNHILYKSR